MASTILDAGPRRAASSANRAAALRMVATLLGLAIAWEALVRGLAIPGYYLPPFSAVFLQVWRAPELFAAGVLRTGGETLLGFVAGGLFGLVSGVLFVHVRIVERMFFPFFVLSQSVPVIAFGALIVIWFGNGILAKVAIAFYLTFFPVTVSTVRGLGAVDPQQVALLRSFGARELKLFLSLRFPTALPLIFVSLRLGIGLSLIGAIVGEWFGDTVGLGVMLLQAMFNEQMPRLWATIVTSALLGSSLYLVIAAIEHRIVWWPGGAVILRVARAAPIWGLPLLGLALVVVVWHGAIAWFALPPFILPSMPSIVARMASDAGPLGAAVAVTLFEAFGGFVLGTAIGVSVAILFVLLPRLDATALPILVAINSVPTVAYSPLALLWFGIGPTSKIVMVALVVGFTLLLNTLHGLKRADPAAIALLRSFGAGPWGIMRRLRLPGALPAIANGLRVGVVRSMIIAIVTEMLGAYRGIGWMIYEGTQTMDFLQVWAAVAVGSLASMAFYGAISWLDRRFIWWR